MSSDKPGSLALSLNSSSTPNNSTTVFRVTLISLVMVLIIVGNITVLRVIYRLKSSHPSLRVANIFLANLALVDLSIGVLLFPFAVSTVILHQWPLGDVGCQLNGAVNMTAGAASILIMAAISVDRYRAIISPPGRKLKSKQAWVLLTALWTWSIIIGLLPVLGWNEYSFSSLNTLCKMSFTKDRGYILLAAVTCFLIPLTIMFYCYLRIFLKVRSHKKQIRRWIHNAEERNLRCETRTTKVVFTVLFVFVTCWTPFVIVHLLHSALAINVSRGVFSIVTLIAGAHSACNPIIYTTMNKTFRAELLDMCACLRCGHVTCCLRHDRVEPLRLESSEMQVSGPAVLTS